jgi:hypothetical protein
MTNRREVCHNDFEGYDAMKILSRFSGVALLLFGLCWPAMAQVGPGGGSTGLPTTNRSVVITTGNTFQAVVAAGPKKSLTIQNNTATDNCWITFGVYSGTTITAANATVGRSIVLAAGQGYSRFYPYIPVDEIEATCATSADTLYVDVQ